MRYLYEVQNRDPSNKWRRWTIETRRSDARQTVDMIKSCFTSHLKTRNRSTRIIQFISTR